MPEYTIAEARSTSDLEELVNRFIDVGWEPIGGISVVPIGEDVNSVRFNGEKMLCQAMIRGGESFKDRRVKINHLVDGKRQIDLYATLADQLEEADIAEEEN